MLFVRRHALWRHVAVLVVGIVAVVAVEVTLPGSNIAPESSIAVAADGTTYDPALRASECALLGRVFVRQLGCARDSCVGASVPWRKVSGAEACALAGQPRGFGYAATVDVRECRALHRRWIPAANYCASQPDRSLRVVPDAPQCTEPASVYVVLAEQPGHYDQCLTAAAEEALSRRADADGATLAAEAAADQRAAEPTQAGPLVVGDSVTWRGGDELARIWARLTVDGEPGRRPTELAARLRSFRTGHGWPTGLIVELGTNPSQNFHRRDLAAAVRTLPRRTPVLLVLPYVETGTDPVVLSAWSQRFAGWMRSVASGRPHTCVGDWPAYVESHPGLLQDGIHTQNADEGVWARWVMAQWLRCFPVE